MLNSLTHEITLSIQARSGTSVAVIVWLAIVAVGGVYRFRVSLRRRLCLVCN